jgi:hypothetical protein
MRIPISKFDNEAGWHGPWDLGDGGGISFKGISLGGSKANAEVNITMYRVDSRTGQVKASTKVVGKSAKSKSPRSRRRSPTARP